ncbi:hypothetical protein [Streptococcus cristatus]|uniref:hypothetical protein n=1 Tax=Streptococcus cristatus TaxID=45634 RepID=UPI0035272A89
MGKTTYELLVHFNENATEIMLRELRRKSDEKKMILIKKFLTSSNRKNSEVCVSSILQGVKSRKKSHR